MDEIQMETNTEQEITLATILAPKTKKPPLPAWVQPAIKKQEGLAINKGANDARRYYSRHRDRELRRKLLEQVRLHGRIPKRKTLDAHDVKVSEIMDLWREFRNTPGARTPGAKEIMKMQVLFMNEA